MTKKTARKTAARDRQQKTGQSYQSALRAQGPDNVIRRKHTDLLRLYEAALIQCALALDENKYEGYPDIHLGLTFYFPFTGDASKGGHGPQIKCFPAHNLKDPLPDDLTPTTHKDVHGPSPQEEKPYSPFDRVAFDRISEADAEYLRGQPVSPKPFTGATPSDPDLKSVENPLPWVDHNGNVISVSDLKARMTEAFMILNSGLGFTGHLAPTRDSLLSRINQACRLLAGYNPDDTISSTFVPASEIAFQRSLLEKVLKAGGTIKEFYYPFQAQDHTLIHSTQWELEGELKRCIAPKRRLLGVTDGKTVRWFTLTSCKDDPAFMEWWHKLPEAEPYARFQNDHH